MKPWIHRIHRVYIVHGFNGCISIQHSASWTVYETIRSDEENPVGRCWMLTTAEDIEGFKEMWIFRQYRG